MMHPTPEQLAALDRWRMRFGPRWKIELRAAWESGNYCTLDRGYLQQLRNQFGPAWLSAYRPGDTRVAWLKPGRQERLRTRKSYLADVWRIVDASGADLIQPWFNRKNDARCHCRDHHITLIES